MPLTMRPTGLGSGIAVSRQVHLALFYEARLDPAVMRSDPEPLASQTLCQLAERIEAAMHRTSKAQEYRDHAEDCRLQAEQCSTEIEKEHWGKMAEEWLRMARDADTWRD